MRLAGYVAQGAAARNNSLCVLLYLIPLLGMGAAMLDVSGIDFSALINWIRPPRPEPAT